VIEPTAEPTAEPSGEEAAESRAEQVAEPQVDPVAEPTDEPSAAPSVDSAAASKAQRPGKSRPAGRGGPRRGTRVAKSGAPLFDGVDHRVESAIEVHSLTKRFGGVTAVDDVRLTIPSGSFAGFVGPNGAGKTTTLAMITGMLRPDLGTVSLYGVDVWRNPTVAKRNLGVLPDRLRLFDRLTGVEFLHHAGALRGLDHDTIVNRTADLAIAFGIEHSLDRFVSDYSAGMVKKVAIAAAMIHSPRVLVLDEPFESVDPVSAAVIIEILQRYVAAGGTVILSSHSMDLIERVCDSVTIIVEGRILANGPMADVIGSETLESRFVELAGGTDAVEGMEWLQSFSD